MRVKRLLAPILSPVLVPVLFWFLTAAAAGAQLSSEKILPLDGRLAGDGRAVELTWFDADPPRVGSVSVNRRLHGQLGGATWQPLATGLGPVMRYTDTTIRPGVAYEYQVVRTARDIVDVGYWVTGTDLPGPGARGHAYLVVDDTVADAIGPRLHRFSDDLAGDGWQVHLHRVPRGDPRAPAETLDTALSIRDWLQTAYHQDPFGRHTVILVGHVPVVLSGRANPDGHEPVAHPSDLFYADMDGRWSLAGDGRAFDSRVPGDTIEMQIGRIDFSPVSIDDPAAEIRLLQAYFDKNHHWRMGLLGDLREAYGSGGHLQAETFALRNIVGPDALRAGGHHDAGEEQPWLWGVDFGDWNGRVYATDYANKAVFAINFGSGKQQIGKPFNQMVALLAQPWYPLAVGWGARPTWWLHHMALGGSIGDVHMRTVNNGTARAPYRESMDYFPTGRYLWRNPVWVNLLGDPTLRAFVLAPPARVSAGASDGGVRLDWAASSDPDVTGYRIYRAAGDGTVFDPLTPDAPVTALSFTDPDPVPGARYMVRAEGRKTVHAGSFHTLSQGVVAQPDGAQDIAGDLQIAGPVNTPIALPDMFHTVRDGRIYAFIEGPATGQLDRTETGWVYTPPEGFAGTVGLRFSVWEAGRTQEAQLTLRIGG